jgi:4-hydroxy-tetrahydrodipicolinate synthase
MCIYYTPRYYFFQGYGKNKMKKKLIFQGAATALITPMKDGSIDYPALTNILEAQIRGGISALVIGGTTGEAATLSDGERYELYSYVKDKVEGRVKIIFGTGTNDTRVAERHTRVASDIGCDGALVVTPYYNKGTYSGVVEHYKRIAESTDVPIILYNVPSRTGVNLTLAQLEELAKIENIVGIKEASDSADRLTELVKFGDGLYLYAGNDSQIYSALALGGQGVISVVSNIYPKAISDICSSYFSGNTKDSLSLQLKLFDFIKLMFRETNPAPIKYAMSLLGLCRSDIRLPLCIPEKSTCDAIKAEIERLGFIG